MLVVGGDPQAFFQAKLLQQNYSWNQGPLFVNTVESDLEAGRAVQQIGFETMQCAVGDKWILWQACFYDWQAKREFYLSKIAASEFRILQEQVRTRLEQMVQSTKFDALSATTTFMSLEKWVSNNIGDELVNSVNDDVCQQQNNIFAIGCEAVSYTHLTLPTICSV